MPATKLTTALSGIDWVAHSQEFLADSAAVAKTAECGMLLATWAKQYESVLAGNPALSFLREMQVQAHYVAAQLSLALYKPAASSLRTIAETGLYFTYFKDHPVELETLVRRSTYYLTKTELVEYHQMHTPGFNKKAQALGVVEALNDWYREISAVIHGQLPGSWVTHRTLASIKPSAATQSLALDHFERAVKIAHHLLLCTVSQEEWLGFNTTARRKLLKGLAGDKKAALGLSVA